MKLIKKLKAYNPEEAKGAYFGFGMLRAKNYEKDRYGHLLLFSFKLKIKKLFIPI